MHHEQAAASEPERGMKRDDSDLGLSSQVGVSIYNKSYYSPFAENLKTVSVSCNWQPEWSRFRRFHCQFQASALW